MTPTKNKRAEVCSLCGKKDCPNLKLGIKLGTSTPCATLKVEPEETGITYNKPRNSPVRPLTVLSIGNKLEPIYL